MPRQNKSKIGGVQTTVSKFFVQSSTSSTKGSKKVANTDDDCKITEVNFSKKRQNADVSKAHGETVSKSKKICTETETFNKDQKDKLPQLTDQSEDTLKNSGSQSFTKLKDFEFLERDNHASGEERSFKSRNCIMISFNNEASAGAADDGDNENGDDELALQSSVSLPPLSKEALPKQGVQGKRLVGNPATKTVKYTPLEQQVIDIKTQRPDALLCVECGYRYRFFGEDAEIASKVLKIYCHLDHNFMTASIPTHRLFVHVRRLVAAGYKVGVVKQVETAHLKAASDNKSGPFTRKLTALYTKSTLIGQDVDPLVKNVEEEGSGEDVTSSLKKNQHLLCIYEHPVDGSAPSRHVGIVSVDPATGDIIFDDFKDGPTCSELETRISHLHPVEIILSSAASDCLKSFVTKTSAMCLRMTDDDNIRVETTPDKNFAKPMSTVKEFYQDASSLSFVGDLPKPTLSCLAALCVYLKDFHLESVLNFTSSFRRFSEQQHFMHLSSQCLHNLEVFRNSCDGSEKGSLFWMLDHTRTKFGSRMLRRWLNQPLLDKKAIQERQDSVEELLEGGNTGIAALGELMVKLPDLERGLCAILHQKCSPAEFCNVTYYLERVRKATEGLAASVKSSLLQSLLGRIFESLEGVGAYNKSINSKGTRDADMSKVFVDGLAWEGLGPMYATKEKLASVLDAIQEHRREVRLALRQPGLNYTTILQTEFLIEVKNTQLKAVPSDWVQINSTKTVSRFHTPFLVEKYERLNQLREQLQRDANEAWRIFLKEFAANFVLYKNAVTELSTMDCLMSLANVASKGTYCKPHLDSSGIHIEIDGGRHPVIEALSNGQDQFVPNNTSLSNIKGPRVITVSGPNMGGKSSYIRQVALITILAQIGSYVPATAASLGIFDAVYTRMGASDDIFKGRSTFMMELQEAADIIAQATDRSLVILDELGRGTSTHDGVAIAHATLKHFITKCSCLVIFVTHFPMMSEFQAEYSSIVSNHHMAFMLDKGQSEGEVDVLTFLYQLTEGAAARSYGLNVARLAEIPTDILQVAAKKSELLEKTLTKKRYTRRKFLSLYKADPTEIQKTLDEIQQS